MCFVFSKWLVDRMKEGKITQTNLAQAVGVTQPAVSRWVRGEVLPSSQRISALARCLRVDVAEVVNAFDPTRLDVEAPTGGDWERLLRRVDAIESALDQLTPEWQSGRR